MNIRHASVACFWPSLALLLLTFTVTACGGGSGGGGGGSSGGGIPPPGGSIPTSPPAPPALGYSGQTQQASATEAQGEAFGATLLESIRDLYAVSALALDEPVDQLFSNGVLDRTLPGDGGGTVRLTGRLASDGTGWIAADYQNFVDDGATLSGREVQQILAPITATSGRVRLSFTDLRVEDGADSYRLNGSLTRHDINRASGRFDISGDLMIRRDGAAPLRAGPLDLTVDTRNESAGRVARIGATGRAFVAEAGFVEIDTAADWVFDAAPDELSPTPRAGESRLRGTAARSIVLAALNSSFGSLVFESPDGNPRHKRFDWAPGDVAPVPGNRLLLAGAGAERTILLGEPVRLEGRFAVHRHGAALDHRWRLLAAPPGSAAVLTDSDTPTPRLIPDRSGTYLIEQRVSDGQAEAYDTVRLFVTPAANDPRLTEPQTDPGPDLSLAPGELLQLDARRTIRADGRLLHDVAWVEFAEDRLRSPSDRHLQFTDRNSPTTTVTTNRPGYYEVTLRSSTEGGQAIQMLYVDYPWRFLPPVHLPGADGLQPSFGSLVVTDIDRNGAPDIALLSAGEAFGDRILRLWRGLGAGALEDPVELAFSLELSETSLLRDGLAVVDADNGSGHEIIAAVERSLLSFELTPDGTLQQGPVLETAVDCEAFTLPLATGFSRLQATDLTGNGRLDLVRAIPCAEDAAVEILLRQVDGSWLALAPLALPSFMTLAMGDLNGDGLADMVISRQDEQNQAVVEIGYGDGEGGFSFVPMFAARELGLVLGDIDNDGRLDVVMLVTAADATQTLVVLRQALDGSLQMIETPVVTPRPVDATAMDLVDIGGDGLPDVVAHGVLVSAVFRQSAPLVFDPVLELPVRRPWGSVAESNRAWVDFDGDGLVDFIGIETRGRPEARGLGIVLQAPLRE